MKKQKNHLKKAAICTAALFTIPSMFSGCGRNTEIRPETETTSLSVTSESAVSQVSENIESVIDSFYVKVTDYTGDEKYLHYITDDPEKSVYVNLSENEEYHGTLFNGVTYNPASETEFGTFAEFADFISSADFKYTTMKYYAGSENVQVSSYSENKNCPEKFNDIVNIIGSLDPEYVEMEPVSAECRKQLLKEIKADNEDITDEEAKAEADKIMSAYDFDPLRYLCEDNEYNSMKPLNTLCFEVDEPMWSYGSIRFFTYEGRIAAKAYMVDFSDLTELVYNSGRIPDEEALTEAFNSSSYSMSEWFYADSTPLYNILLEYIIDGQGNGLPNVDQKNPDELMFYNFSSEFEKCFNVKSVATDGYQNVTLGDISMLIPDYFENIMNIPIQMRWESGENAPDNMDISFRIEKSIDRGFSDFRGLNDEKPESLDYADGSFNGNPASYSSYFYPESKVFRDRFTFTAADGVSYEIVYELNSDERNEIYAEMVKNTMGSISLASDSISVGEDVIENNELILSSEPVSYCDGGEELAHGYSVDGYSYYKAYSPVIINSSFYVTDMDMNYKTNSEWKLEKLCDDGLWYTVIPDAKILYMFNETRHFPNALEEDREYVVADLSCYPLLPEGKYRIAKPFWKNGSDEQYAAVYEFEMTSQADFGEEMTIEAQCEYAEYSSSADVINYSVVFPNQPDCGLIGSIADIEYLSAEGWKSVCTNGYDTSLAYYKRPDSGFISLYTENYNISQNGDYRICISAGNDCYPRNTAITYAYFKIKN